MAASFLSMFLRVSFLAALALGCSEQGGQGSQGGGRGRNANPTSSSPGEATAGKQTSSEPTPSGALTSADQCKAQGNQWFYDSEKRVCIELSPGQTGDALCSSKGTGWVFDPVALECSKVKTGGEKSAEEACKTKGSQWVYDSIGKQCVEKRASTDARQLCRDKKGADAVFNPTTGSCTAPVRGMMLVAAPAATGSICDELNKGDEVWIYHAATQSCVKAGKTASMAEVCRGYGEQFVWYWPLERCAIKDQSISTKEVCEALARDDAAHNGGNLDEYKCIYQSGSQTFGVMQRSLTEAELCELNPEAIFKQGNPSTCENPASNNQRARSDIVPKYKQLEKAHPTTVTGTVSDGVDANALALRCPSEPVETALLNFELQQELAADGKKVLTAIRLQCISASLALTTVSYGRFTAGAGVVSKKVTCGKVPPDYSFPVGVTVSSAGYVNDITSVSCVDLDHIERKPAAGVKEELNELLKDPVFAANFDPTTFNAQGYVAYSSAKDVATPSFGALANAEKETMTSQALSCDTASGEKKWFLRGFSLKAVTSAAGDKKITSLQPLCTTVTFDTK